MNVHDAIRSATQRLQDAEVETPHLDAVLLVGYCLGVEKEELFREPERELPRAVAQTLDHAVGRRAAGTPISYIRRRKEFYGREFYVDERVLVPRPETETLVEHALGICDTDLPPGPAGVPGTGEVHDCCSGSGCIAITLKAERPELRVSASDVSPGAVEVARLNATRLLPNSDIDIRHGDLLEALRFSPAMITANPPYVASADYRRMEAADWPEPAVALEAGVDGLSILRRLIPAAFATLLPNGYFVCEIGYDQGDAVRRVARKAGFEGIRLIQDLGGRDRVLSARRTDGNGRNTQHG